jgi:competence ComEA-like helix-hairpin-helix protein
MLDLTPSEKRALSSLILVIGMAGVFQIMKPMSVNSEHYNYSKDDSIFQRKSKEYFTPTRSTTEKVAGISQDQPHAKTIYPANKKKDQRTPPKPGTIDLNSASAAVLETLPHIGPAMAARIIEFRKTNGKFKSVTDLKNVKGIGTKILESIKPYFKPINPATSPEME